MSFGCVRRALMVGAVLLLCIVGSAFAAMAQSEPGEKCTPSMQDLILMMSWKNIQWPADSNSTDNAYSEPYNASAMIPIRMQMWSNQAFLTFPRYRPGIPFSLGYVMLTSLNRFDAELYAFPSWMEHTRDTYASIVNAVDIFMDQEGGMLWVLDTGLINTLVKPLRIAPPRIFAIHVIDRKVMKVIDLSDLVCPESRLQFLVADVVPTDEGEEGATTVNLFVSDAGTRSLLVYNGAMTSDSHSFRVQLPPLLCLRQSGCNQDVLHLALVKTAPTSLCANQSRTYQSRLYFSYLSGEDMFSASAKAISQGKTFASVSQVGHKPMRMLFLGAETEVGGHSQLFFREQDDNVIFSWSVIEPFDSDNFVQRDRPESCRQATSVVATGGYKGLVWALESNIWDYLYGSVGSMGAGAWIRPLSKYW